MNRKKIFFPDDYFQFGNANNLQKCEYCKGSDGKAKIIYKTHISAIEAAKHLEELRGVFLTIFQCPHGNGYHLTKKNAKTNITQRKEQILNDIGIPLKSSNGLWEYIEDVKENDSDSNIAIIKNAKIDPIKKIEYNIANSNLNIIGRIMELNFKINIENLFKIDLNNIIASNIMKNIFRGTISQITIFSEERKDKIIESYTLLVDENIMNNSKFSKGDFARISIIGKEINNVKFWYCNKIQKYKPE
jgi:hypothetical protein